MSHAVMQQKLAEFDSIAAQMRLKMGDKSPVKAHFDTMREFLADVESDPNGDRDAKWGLRFLEYYQARFVVARLANAVIELQGLPGLKKTLDRVLAGSIVQDFEPTQAKDSLYELELAADLKAAGFRVELREPDIVAHDNGLSKPLAMACKYPSSRDRLHDNITKGYQQITGQNLEGVVAMGLDSIIGKEADLGPILDFRQGVRPPLEVLQRQLAQEVDKLVEERARDYPSERPLDGLLLTLTPGGLYGQPADLVILHAATMRCASGNALATDLEVVKRKLEALNP